MFFKSRAQREIDEFKATHRAYRGQQNGRSDLVGLTGQHLSADEPAVSLGDETNHITVKQPDSVANERNQSVVSVNSKWQGKLTTDGSVWLEGELSGEIEAGETVFVANGAKVRANIHARKAIIGGDMEGQICCQEQLVVERGGCLGGKVSTKTLVVEDGAVVRSDIQMVRDETGDSRHDAGTITIRRAVPAQAGNTERKPTLERRAGSSGAIRNKEMLGKE